MEHKLSFNEILIYKLSIRSSSHFCRTSAFAIVKSSWFEKFMLNLVVVWGYCFIKFYFKSKIFLNNVKEAQCNSWTNYFFRTFPDFSKKFVFEKNTHTWYRNEILKSIHCLFQELDWQNIIDFRVLSFQNFKDFYPIQISRSHQEGREVYWNCD